MTPVKLRYFLLILLSLGLILVLASIAYTFFGGSLSIWGGQLFKGGLFISFYSLLGLTDLALYTHTPYRRSSIIIAFILLVGTVLALLANLNIIPFLPGTVLGIFIYATYAPLVFLIFLTLRDQWNSGQRSMYSKRLFSIIVLSPFLVGLKPSWLTPQRDERNLPKGVFQAYFTARLIPGIIFIALLVFLVLVRFIRSFH